jgi:putative flippase GtrA
MSVDAHGLRHWLGFLVSGVLALSTDVAVSTVLADGLGVAWPLARPVAIAVAMVVGFFAHRRLTFAKRGRPTLDEFGRYVAVAWSAAALNYAVFLGLLWALPTLMPQIAIIGAALVAMVAAYLGFRFAVFTR